MSTDIHHRAILASLAPLFETAENGKLWFFHETTDGEPIWCSPEYLRGQQAQGRLIMAPEHWELRNPVGYLAHLIAEIGERVDEYNALAEKLGLSETIALESHSTHPADAH